MNNESSVPRLEDVVNCSYENLIKLKKSIYGAFFLADENKRVSRILFLNNIFDNGLRKGYLERSRLFLVVNVEGYGRAVDVGEVPKRYMDVGYYPFQIR